MSHSIRQTVAPATGENKRLVAIPGSGAMFDGIAERYDLLNHLMSFGFDGRWRAKLVSALACPDSGHVLDVATGTADVAIRIARTYPNARITGIDPSACMLAAGHRKLAPLGLRQRVVLFKADLMTLPFADDTFDASCISFGIRNVRDRTRGIAQMARATRPGGRVAVLELSEPGDGILGRLARLHVHHIVPWLGSLISGTKEYRYLQSSIEAFPNASAFAATMAEVGLKDVTAQRLCFGAVHLYVGTT